MESNAPRVRLCSQDDSRTHNEGQTPGGDVFSMWYCGNQGYDSDSEAAIFIIGKRQAAFVTTVIPFDI